MKNIKYMRRFEIVLSVFVMLMLAMSGPLHAATIAVPSQYSTINAALTAASSGDTIQVSQGNYPENLVIDKKVKLAGVSNPVIKYVSGYPNMVSLKADDIEMSGFIMDSLSGGALMGTVNCIDVVGTIKNITLTSCYFKMGAGSHTSGIAVDNNAFLQNASISSCTFIGLITNVDSSWFFVGDGVSGSGSADGITLANNEIKYSTSELRLNKAIKNVKYDKNVFNDSNGYIKISKPGVASGLIQGITITNNTFNSTSFSNDYAVLIDNVQDIDVGNAWSRYFVINHNNFLQTDKGGAYPIVGFKDASFIPSSNVNAKLNWWSIYLGPKIWASGQQSGIVEISDHVDYSPWRGALVGTKPMKWYTDTTIQPAITAASDYDTVYVIANTGGYIDPITITKKLALLGKKSDKTRDAWATASGSDSGPTIKNKINFNAAGIRLQGIAIDTISATTASVCSFFTGTVQSPTITYCSFNLNRHEGDRGISIDNGSAVKNATISNCNFTGAITECRWFMVDGAGTGGSLDGATLANNSITGATSELQLFQPIKNVTYSGNVFSAANGYILLSESSAGTTASKFQNIQINGNTFNHSSRPLEFAILVWGNVEDGDATSWNTVVLRDNKFLQYDIGGSYPNVGFQTAITTTYNTNIDAKQNWWYDAQGPRPWQSGIQDSKVEVSNYVDYRPWYGSATTDASKQNVTVGRNANTIAYADTIQGAINASQDGDVINVKKISVPYSSAIVIDKQVDLIGRKSDGTTNAWTVNTPGSAADAPVIKGTAAKLVTVGSSKVNMYGFNIDSSLTPSSPPGIGMYVSGDISHLTVSYCSFAMKKGDKGIAVNDGNTARDVAVTNCSFTGEAVTSPVSNWFSVGAGTTGAGDGGSIDIDERGYGARLSHNIITQAGAELLLDRKIKNVVISNNEFNNSNGYILLDKPYPATAADGLIQGITMTYNTFKNSTTFPDEYAVLIFNSRVTEADANNNWNKNITINFNNVLQNAQTGHQYPIVGFDSIAFYSTEINAAHNWWNSMAGPLIFPGDDPVIADVSFNVNYDNYSRAAISGGMAAVIQPGILKTITDTSINLDLTVRTNAGGPAPVFAAKYSDIPVAITTGLPSAVNSNDVFYDILVYPSSASNINYITSTFNFSASASSVYWYNITSTSWVPWNAGHISTASGKLTIWSGDASSWPSISQLTGTPICIKGAAILTTTTTTVSGSTTSVRVSSTTTTASGTSTSVVATTTTSVGGATTTVRPNSTTSSVRPTTTTTAPQPKLTISPVSLHYGTDTIAQTFTITNTGVGTLIWSINKADINYEQGVDWIFDVAPASGETNTEQDTVTVTINRAGLDPGTYSASIPVSSNGGDKSLSITMEVAAAEDPVLSLNPTVLYLTATAASGTVDIANTGTGTLIWKLGEPVYVNGNGINWISGVTPPSGSTTQEKVTVTITVNRDRLRGGIYIANIPLTSNGGNRTLGVVMFVARDSQKYPRAKVDPFIVFLKKGDTVKTFTITNAGTGTLVWQLGAVQYPSGQQGGWITSVSPLSGETTTDTAAITVNLDTSIFKPTDRGLFGATIPVKSNGGNKNVFLYIWVPLLQYQ